MRAAHNSVWHALLLHLTSETQSMNHARKIRQFLHEFAIRIPISSYQENNKRDDDFWKSSLVLG